MGAIYVQRDGQQYGPLTRDGLQPYLDAGVLSVEDWAVEEGGTEWVPLGSLLQTAAVAEEVAVIPEVFREQSEIEVNLQVDAVPGAMADVSAGRKKIAVAVLALGLLGGGSALGFYLTTDSLVVTPPEPVNSTVLADILKESIGPSTPPPDALPPLELPDVRSVPLPLQVGGAAEFQKTADAAKAGDPVGAFHLAVRLHEGWGTAPQYSQSVTNAEISEAAVNAPAAAKIFLGYLYMNGRTSSAKMAKVPELFEEEIVKAVQIEAKRPDPYAHYVLGLRELPSRGYRGDLPRVLHHFAAAGRSNFPPAFYQLGNLHLRGIGVPRNPQKAAEYFAIAAQAGHADALRLLALMYLRGDGLKQNPKESLRLTEAAARIGNTEAQFNMAIALDQGKVTDANQTVACQWFMLAATARPVFGQHVMRLKNQLSPEQFQTAADLARAINPDVIVPVTIPVPPGITKPAESGLAPPKVEPKLPKTTPEKLIDDPIVEKAVRIALEKPEGELTEADLAKVNRLNLIGAQIANADLKELAKLRNLAHLDINNTKITNEGLKELAKLKKLKSLGLWRTDIADEGLKEVAKLQNLTDLLLDNTFTSDLGLKEVAKLQNLRSLRLLYTKITDTGLKELTKLRDLESLNLYFTEITNEGLKEVAKLQNLRELFLPDKITEEGLKEVAKLQKLEALYFVSNLQTTVEGLKEVVKLQNLKGLYLNGTNVTDEGLKELVKLQKLKVLELKGTKITDEGLKEVAKLRNLTGLNLSSIPGITDQGLKEVANLQNLRMINLWGINVTDEGLKELAKLQNLRNLLLNNTKVTKAGVAELQKALPNCQIAGP